MRYSMIGAAFLLPVLGGCMGTWSPNQPYRYVYAEGGPKHVADWTIAQTETGKLMDGCEALAGFVYHGWPWQKAAALDEYTRVMRHFEGTLYAPRDGGDRAVDAAFPTTGADAHSAAHAVPWRLYAVYSKAATLVYDRRDDTELRRWFEQLSPANELARDMLDVARKMNYIDILPRPGSTDQEWSEYRHAQEARSHEREMIMAKARTRWATMQHQGRSGVSRSPAAAE